MDNIVLIGFMASGKTTIGRALANKRDMDFIDTDKCISDKMDLTVGEIFKEKGEDYFRKLETNTVRLFSTNLNNTVLSTGGGLPIREENVPYLKKIGKVVFLKVSNTSVLERLNTDIERPLLSGDNPEKKIDDLLEQRNPIYERVSDLVIDTNSKSVEMIVNELMERL